MANNDIDARALLQANTTIIAGLFILIAVVASIQQPSRLDDYLFTWNYTISGDSHNIPPKLKEYLIDNYGITWLDRTNITRTDKEIKISANNTNVPDIIIKLRDKNNATLHINGKKVTDLGLEVKNNNLYEIYSKFSRIEIAYIVWNVVSSRLQLIFVVLNLIFLIPFGSSMLMLMCNNMRWSRLLTVSGMVLLIAMALFISIMILLTDCFLQTQQYNMLDKVTCLAFGIFLIITGLSIIIIINNININNFNRIRNLIRHPRLLDLINSIPYKRIILGSILFITGIIIIISVCYANNITALLHTIIRTLDCLI